MEQHGGKYLIGELLSNVLYDTSIVLCIFCMCGCVPEKQCKWNYYMLDIHIHILPGVDDGAQDYDDAIGMAELALRSGVTTIVATPHANQIGRFENFYTPELSRRYERLEDMLHSSRQGLRVLEGQEIMASDDMAQKIKDGRLISLNHTQYYLIEFPFDAYPGWITDRLTDVIRLGKTPLIAHVERYYCVQGVRYPDEQGKRLREIWKRSQAGYRSAAQLRAYTLYCERCSQCDAADSLDEGYTEIFNRKL